MNRYRVTGRRPVHDNAPGEEFEHDFTAEEEADHLAAGRLEVVAVAYEVVGANDVFETPPGGTFTAALPSPQRDALIAGGHITPASEKPAPKSTKAPKGAK